jgi:hypothetical protein
MRKKFQQWWSAIQPISTKLTTTSFTCHLNSNCIYIMKYQCVKDVYSPGVDSGGGAHPARAPPKIGKNMIFWRKIVIFHTKYPKYFGVRSLFRQPIIPTAHCSDGPLFRQPIAPTAHFSDHPLFRQK